MSKNYDVQKYRKVGPIHQKNSRLQKLPVSITRYRIPDKYLKAVIIIILRSKKKKKSSTKEIKKGMTMLHQIKNIKKQQF